MGLADREYMRNQPRRRGGPDGGGGLPIRRIMLSMTMWLIIINVAVFAIDQIVVKAGFGAKIELAAIPVANSSPTNRSQLVTAPNYGEKPSSLGGGLYERPLFDKQTGKHVANQLLAYKPPMEALGYFSTLRITELQVWRFVTFQFLHTSGAHLFMNMLGLFFFGPIAEQYLGSRRLFLAFYLICGIAGAMLYLLLNLAGAVLPFQLPLVLANEPWVPLVGASAGVFGVLWAAAFLRGRELMYVFGIVPVQIRVGVAIFTAFAFFNLVVGGTNAGGDAAHIGGAIAGAYFIRKPHLLLNFFDEFLGTSDRHAKFQRSGRGGGRRPAITEKSSAKRPSPSRSDQRLNAILDKVHEQGAGALTPAEKRFLERESERRGGRG